MKASGNFGRGGRFEEQRERLDEVGSRFFNRRTLARNVELRAQRYKTVILTFDNRGQALRWLHDPSLHQFKWIKPASGKDGIFEAKETGPAPKQWAEAAL